MRENLYVVGAADVLPIVDKDLKRIAARVIENAKELCIRKSVFNFSTLSFSGSSFYYLKSASIHE